MLACTEIIEPTLWNSLLQMLPSPHVLQTWEWGAFKERHGWEASRWLWGTESQPRAAATILSRPLTRTGRRILYIPKGPTLDWDDASQRKKVLSDVEYLARAERALFVKLDPDILIDNSQGEAVTALLAERGWLASREQIQFRNTHLLDLTPDLDDIMAGFKSKWRYNIRLAERRGVSVEPGGLDDLPLLYQMYADTSLRNRFVIRSEEYYLDAWRTFVQADMARPLIARAEGEPVAMIILFYLGQRAWYMYGASRSLHREKMPNHLLQWEGIRWARSRGCTSYDLWGAPDELDQSDPMWGVHRFKAGFGTQVARHIGAYDFAISRLGYWLYTSVAPRLLALMRWTHWRGRPGEVGE
jgi:lipid II:glycine glycyltransferase (peptidoglycan interpeptide bridge formation enzyme)